MNKRLAWINMHNYQKKDPIINEKQSKNRNQYFCDLAFVFQQPIINTKGTSRKQKNKIQTTRRSIHDSPRQILPLSAKESKKTTIVYDTIMTMQSRQDIIHSRKNPRFLILSNGTRRQTSLTQKKQTNRSKEKVKNQIISGQKFINFQKTRFNEYIAVRTLQSSKVKYRELQKIDDKTQLKINALDWPRRSKSAKKEEKQIKSYRPWSPLAKQAVQYEYFTSQPNDSKIK